MGSFDGFGNAGSVELPTSSGAERRVAQRMWFSFWGKGFYVFNTHFQHGNYSSLRRSQGQALQSWAATHPGTRFLLGDMNATANSWDLEHIRNANGDMIASFHPSPNSSWIDHVWGSSFGSGGVGAGHYDTGVSDHFLFWYDVWYWGL